MARLHLSGPMRGLPSHNFPAFEAAASHLRSLDHYGTSPHEHDLEMGFVADGPDMDSASLRKALAWDLDQVCHSDALILLPGWESSRGAALEVHAALVCDVPCYLYDPDHITGIGPRVDEWELRDAILDVLKDPIN